ncbi:MAG: hypothetical protein HRT71_14890 [Flavobacteriales bacterium]|nr:hypothetical protein [Flavobacteriales bacterium]
MIDKIKYVVLSLCICAICFPCSAQDTDPLNKLIHTKSSFQLNFGVPATNPLKVNSTGLGEFSSTINYGYGFGLAYIKNMENNFSYSVGVNFMKQSFNYRLDLKASDYVVLIDEDYVDSWYEYYTNVEFPVFIDYYIKLKEKSEVGFGIGAAFKIHNKDLSSTYSYVNYLDSAQQFYTLESEYNRTENWMLSARLTYRRILKSYNVFHYGLRYSIGVKGFLNGEYVVYDQGSIVKGSGTYKSRGAFFEPYLAYTFSRVHKKAKKVDKDIEEINRNNPDDPVALISKKYSIYRQKGFLVGAGIGLGHNFISVKALGDHDKNLKQKIGLSAPIRISLSYRFSEKLELLTNASIHPKMFKASFGESSKESTLGRKNRCLSFLTVGSVSWYGVYTLGQSKNQKWSLNSKLGFSYEIFDNPDGAGEGSRAIAQPPLHGQTYHFVNDNGGDNNLLIISGLSLSKVHRRRGEFEFGLTLGLGLKEVFGGHYDYWDDYYKLDYVWDQDQDRYVVIGPVPTETYYYRTSGSYLVFDVSYKINMSKK